MDVDVYFGPFTCIAGGNAVGKSNLFDAIMFLSSLTDVPLLEAAMAVRDKTGRSSDVRSLFHATQEGRLDTITFEAEMIVPPSGVDDLGQEAKASITFLQYGVEIVRKSTESDGLRPQLEITREELNYVSMGDAMKHLPFKSSPKWKKSVVKGRRTSKFISTTRSDSGNTVRLHQEGRAGRTKEFRASTLPRTVLSTVNAAESPTALLARREMQSWRLLQLEPSALRTADSFTAPTEMGTDGSHLAATLYHLANSQRSTEVDVYASVSNRLSQLVEDVRQVRVERDDKRELLTLVVDSADGTSHPARSLSDGTLRFLALAVLGADPNARGVLCLEEPENGIHPERIVAMLRLLQDLAVDIREPVGDPNPLRQVIITTHSPTVVAQVQDDSLLFAEKAERSSGRGRSSVILLRHMEKTWRDHTDSARLAIQRGQIIKFLRPVREKGDEDAPKVLAQRRVIDRPDLSQLSLWPGSSNRIAE